MTIHIIDRMIKYYRKFLEINDLLSSENSRFIRYAKPGHYYSPIPDANEIRSNEDVIYNRSIKNISGININEDKQLELVNGFSSVYADIHLPEQKTDDNRYYFDNGYFSYGDGVALYSILRLFKPKKVIEVGSGYSSAAMLDICDRFLGGEVKFTFIEPYAERLLGLLNADDMKRVEILKKPVQDVPLDVYRQLEPNDVLFVDSSHVAKIHSDVLHILFNILPSLNRGVLIHFHDIVWPFEYPKKWLDEGRAWNEAYMLRAFLSYNDAYEIILFNSFMEHHHADILQNKTPLMMKSPTSDITPGNSSLWIKKTN